VGLGVRNLEKFGFGFVPDLNGLEVLSLVPLLGRAWRFDL
jgi:hypothetical protein